jgi:hypothetical protein
VVTERQRRGKDSNVLERIAREREQDANVRLANAAEAGKLERETPELEKAIIDTETSLKKALELRDLKTPRREREQVITNAKLTPEEARRLAQRRWLEGREAFLQGRERAADSRPKSLDLDLGL